jgi:hypothetical protein
MVSEFAQARASQRLQRIRLARLLLGDSGVPYDWEQGDQAGKS